MHIRPITISLGSHRVMKPISSALLYIGETANQGDWGQIKRNVGFRVKGPPNSTQATLVVLTNATSLVLEHSFRRKGLGCLWIQFKLANYVIAQTRERKIQWSNMFRPACKATATAKWTLLWVLLHDFRRNAVPIFIRAIFNIRSYQWRQIKCILTRYSSLL